MILTCMLYNALNTCARSVDISHKGCKYSIDLPSGWDTIPHDTLKKIFPRLDLDMGLYPVSQKGIFYRELCFGWFYACFAVPPFLFFRPNRFGHEGDE